MKFKSKKRIFWKKFFETTSLGLAPFITFSAFVAAGCSVQENFSLLSKVNYLAIGDSVTSGFNQDTYQDFQGKMDQNGNVSGQSYPAFFAYYLQKLKKDSLVSFDNLAFSGTTVKNWLHLINPQKYPDGKISDNSLASGYSTNETLSDVEKVFGKFDKSSYPEFIEKIKKANFLTMTLGANDIFFVAAKLASFVLPGQNSDAIERLKKLVPDVDTTDKKSVEKTKQNSTTNNQKDQENSDSSKSTDDSSSTKENKPNSGILGLLGGDFSQLLKGFLTPSEPKKKEEFKKLISVYLKREVDKVFKELEKNLSNLINELKSINRNLRINLIGYNIPNSVLTKILKNLLHNEFGVEVEYFNEVIQRINSVIREVAIKNSVNYVDVYDKNVWKVGDNKYSATKFDFHPNIKGYKKIAHQLLLKLALVQDSEKQDATVSDFGKKTQFDDITNDKKTYSRVIDIDQFAKTNQEFIDKLNDNKETSASIDEETEFEKNQNKNVEPYQRTVDKFLLNIFASKILGQINVKQLLGNSSFSAFVNVEKIDKLFKTIASSTTEEGLKLAKEELKPYLNNPNEDILKVLLDGIAELLQELSEPGKEKEITFDNMFAKIIAKIFPHIKISAFLGFGG
ncbi:Prolipoprotein p65 [Mesomycoplasma dispar]|uniref:Prolipoprotein p65 n=1 Tax=Mesomycoplasma dispar TaxID=86660 RepID=A0AAJ5NKV1_9BACT|nr:SGNH/GDSL hydrolase family protein [Mesomycoplasma dispar]AJR12009.1 lipoprotein [Mesomycoplasma dispar]VEU61329.1 Prolipoprotein p65 [Mesomycoplasma dispar]